MSTKIGNNQYTATNPETRLWLGDCRQVLPERCHGGVVADLIFADPPFNWEVKYDGWNDGMPRDEYLRFTYEWLDRCINVLRPGGALLVNIPDDTVARVVVHLEDRGLEQRNWLIRHYRFGQNGRGRFINSKTHCPYFIKPGAAHTWNPEAVLVQSDRAAKYNDARTIGKSDGSPDGQRLPFDVWGVEGDGPYWGRVQGNNGERRAAHANQLPEVYLERVIRACSNSGDIVLDPFCGSGTTSTVARALGRRSITIEISELTAASAWERITRIGAIRSRDHRISKPTAMPLFDTVTPAIDQTAHEKCTLDP